jgi:hypothetical protein
MLAIIEGTMIQDLLSVHVTTEGRRSLDGAVKVSI